MPIHPILDRLYSGFEQQLTAVDASRTQLRTEDDARRWSVQQIVEHLLLTYAATSENYRQRLDKGSGTKSPVTMQARVGQFVVCTLGRFPQGRKSPSSVMPGADADPETGDALLERAGIELRRFDELARDAERMFGGQRAISHPILGPMSVKNWRLFHLRHGEHHLRQIEAICKAKA